MLVCVAVGAVVAGLRSGAGAGGGVAGPARVSVSSTALPLAGSYSDVEAINGRVIVSGGTQGGLVHGRLTGTCHSATVDPVDLRVLATARGNCADPALYGRHALPVSYVAARRSPLFALALRIAVAAPHAREGYRLGPVVLRYPQCSDCRLEALYGDGSLWIYSGFAAPSMKQSATSGTLLRVSTSTGAVLQRWRLPSFSRPLLAVDADGVWIAQSLFGGMPARLPASQLNAYRYMYRIAPGMRTPTRAFRVGRDGAYWMVASAHTVWLDQVNASAGVNRWSLLWRFVGPAARPIVRHLLEKAGSQCAEMGEGPTSTVGDPQTGVFCLALGPTSDHLQSFDFDTGAGRAIDVPAFKHAPSSIYYDGPQSTAVLGRSVFFLFGPHRLYRALGG